MKRIEYKINDIEASISHTKQDILTYAENIQQILETSNDPEYIKQLEEDREIDIYFLEVLEWVRESLLTKLKSSV